MQVSAAAGSTVAEWMWAVAALRPCCGASAAGHVLCTGIGHNGRCGIRCLHSASVRSFTLFTGLKLDPFNPDLKLALQAANEAVLRDLAEGKARQTLAIEYPEPHKRISYHP